MSNNPLVSKDALADVFNQQLIHLDALLDCILSERQALIDLETETVIQVSEQKKALMTAAEACMQNGRALVEPLKAASPDESIQQIFQRCDPSGDLDRLRERIIALTDRCLNENKRNSIQIRRQNQQVHAALCVLRGEDLHKPFYTASGERSVGYSARVLGKA